MQFTFGYAICICVAYALSPPTAYFINLDSNIDRRNHTEQLLTCLKLDYTRIPAIAPSHFNPSLKIDGDNTRKLYAVTMSHLEAIYQAYRAQKGLGIALILEDDMKFLYQVKSWSTLVNSAPSDWGILQLATSNIEVVNDALAAYMSTKILWQARPNAARGAGAYLVNLPSFSYFFGSMTQEETKDVLTRFDPMIALAKKCDMRQRNQSLPHRLRCAGKVYFYADKYIYRLHNSYLLTFPLVSFAANVTSSLSSNHEKSQTLAAHHLQTLLATVAVEKGTLPNFVSEGRC